MLRPGARYAGGGVVHDEDAVVAADARKALVERTGAAADNQAGTAGVTAADEDVIKAAKGQPESAWFGVARPPDSRAHAAVCATAPARTLQDSRSIVALARTDGSGLLTGGVWVRRSEEHT